MLAPAAGAVFAAVACDGAGSASHGGEGASLAARTLSSLMAGWTVTQTGLPPDEMVVSWFEIARYRIAQHAASRSVYMPDMATTVVLALSHGDETMTAHIGDGAVVGRCIDTSAWLLLSGPDHGENACETFFLTDPGNLQLRLALHSKPIDRLVLFTDGLERLALNFPAVVPHVPFFDGVSDPVAKAALTSFGRLSWLSDELGGYLDSQVVRDRTDDDKTLIIGVLA